MTVADIIARVREIVQERNASNAHRTDASIIGDINSCTLQLCSNIATLPKASVPAIVAADTITLPSTLLRIDHCSISDGATTAKHHHLVTGDFTNFARMNPSYEDQPDTKPEMLIRMTDTDWMMWPNPDANWAGKAVTIVGSVLPTPITLTTESPAVSIALHPCYEHFCSWVYFQVLNNPERAAAEFGIYDALKKLNINTATSTQGSLQSLRMAM